MDGDEGLHFDRVKNNKLKTFVFVSFHSLPLSDFLLLLGWHWENKPICSGIYSLYVGGGGGGGGEAPEGGVAPYWQQ